MSAYREAYPKRRPYQRPTVTCFGTERDMLPPYSDPKARWSKCEPLKFEAAHLRAVKAKPAAIASAVRAEVAEFYPAEPKPGPSLFTWKRIAWALAIGSAVGVKVWMWIQ